MTTDSTSQRNFPLETGVTSVNVTARIATELFTGFVSQSPLWFDSNSGVLSVNTQSRRLGCIIYILGQVARGRKVESLLLSPSTEELAELKKNINSNGFDSGQLTSKASSVKHYLDIAIALHFLVRQGSVFNLTGRGLYLLQAVRPDAAHPYPLTGPSKTFFFHSLLATDYFGLSTIARLLLNGNRRPISIQREYQKELLYVLGGAASSSTSTRLASLAKDRMISIRNWKRPESYAEHLVSAKLHWLADLGILESVPSANTNLAAKKEHRDWLEDLTNTTTPTDSHLLAFTLNYCSTIQKREMFLTADNICSALDEAFEWLVREPTLAKIRCSDFLLFLLCFHTPLLLCLVKNKQKLIQATTVECHHHRYQIHFASRPTQSFIIRHGKKSS